MPTSSASAAAAAAAAVTTLSPSFFSNHPKANLPTNSILTRSRRTTEIKIKISCQAALTTDVSSLASASLSDEELEAESKVGKRIRVKVPLKVYHVNKAPDLDLNGMEGQIKQYVGVWKGKSISANLPFKVEFFVKVEGQEKPVKFLAHLKEDEFEYLDR